MHILVAEYSLVKSKRPLDSEALVKHRYTRIGFGRIRGVYLIQQCSPVACHGKAVSHSRRQEKLTMIFGRKLNSHIAAESRRPFAQVYRYIYDASFHYPHELGLGVRRKLEMKTAYHATP